MISDKLFLAWNCSDCSEIKSQISEAMFSSIVGSNGQILTVIHTFSNDGTRDVLDIFGLDNNYAPALLTYNDMIIDGLDNILSYLKNNGFAK